MTKKQKQKNIGIGIILLILIVGFLAGTGNLPFAIAGASTLSLTQAQLQSNNPFLSGQVWLLTFTEGVLNQRYFGTFSPSNVQDATSDNSRTTNSFSVDVEFEDQKCSYSITGTTANKPIFDVQRITWTYVPFVNPCTEVEAKTRGLSNILFFGRFSGTQALNCFAIGYNTQSPVGNLNSPDLESEYEITINAGTQSGSKRINTLTGSGQGQVGNFAYAVWQGNLVSGKSCLDKDPFTPIYVNGVWRIGSKSSYDDYRVLVSTSPTQNKNNQDIWLNNIQNKIVSAKQSRVFGTIDSQFSLNNAVVKITSPSPWQFPVTTLYIKASTIGIFTPTPEIRLFSPNSDCFKTGETGSIEIGLENVGEDSGTWNVFAECQSPFSSTRNIQVSLQPNEKVTRLIPLSATASQEERSSCTVFAENPAGTKSINVDTCVKPLITCEADEKFCAVSGTDEVVKQCSLDGATSTIIETCGVGTFCQDAKCKIGDKQPDEGFFAKIGNAISNFFKQFINLTGNIILIVKIVLLIGVLLFNLFFTKDVLDNIKAVDKRPGLGWGLSAIITLVLGLLLSLVLFTFLFWIAIGGVGVYLVITRFFRK